MFTVGQVSKRTGISVRTLHHYEEIALFTPSGRSNAGYRLYSLDDMKRLQHILLLRSYQFSLAQIKQMLDADEPPQLSDTIATKIEEIESEIQAQTQALDKLKTLKYALSSERANRSDSDYASENILFDAMEAFVLHEQYFTETQRSTLNQTKDQLDQRAIQDVQDRWPVLIKDVRRAMDAAVAPSSAKAIALAIEWKAMLEAFTGGDADIQRSASHMYASESRLQAQTGITPEVMSFIQSALAHVPLR